MSEHLTGTFWVIFFKVMSVNKLCPVQFIKCPIKKKIWKNICPVNNNEKLFPKLEGDSTVKENALKFVFREIGWTLKANLETSNLFNFSPITCSKNAKNCQQLWKITRSVYPKHQSKTCYDFCQHLPVVGVFSRNWWWTSSACCWGATSFWSRSWGERSVDDSTRNTAARTSLSVSWRETNCGSSVSLSRCEFSSSLALSGILWLLWTSCAS